MTDYNMPLGASISDYEDMFEDDYKMCPNCYEDTLEVTYQDKYVQKGYCHNCEKDVEYESRLLYEVVGEIYG